MRTIVFSGHRPPKTGLTYTHESPTDLECVRIVREWIAWRQPDLVNVGGALGFDTLAARAAWLQHVPFDLYIPYPGYEDRWPAEARERLEYMKQAANDWAYTDEGPYRPYLMQVRNEVMVDQSTEMAVWWDGSPGGTRNAIEYARSIGMVITNLYKAGPRT